jgi:hypothetical protein
MIVIITNNKAYFVVSVSNSVVVLFKEKIGGTKEKELTLPRTQNQISHYNDQFYDSRNGTGEIGFGNFTIEVSESSHFKNLVSIEVSTSYYNEDTYKHTSSYMSDDIKPRTKREIGDWKSKRTEVFPSPNLCVEINVGEEPCKREDTFGDITKPPTGIQFSSGTQSEIFPKDNRRSQVIASTSSDNDGIRSHHNTSHPSSTQLSRKESEALYNPFGKQYNSQTSSDTTGIESGHQHCTSISNDSQESQCFQEGCIVPRSVERSADEYTKIGNRSEAKENKLSDLNDKACTESQKDYLNKSQSKSSIMKPDTPEIESGTISLGAQADTSGSFESCLPGDGFTSYMTHSTSVTEASPRKSFVTFSNESTPVIETSRRKSTSNKSTSVTGNLPEEPSVSLSTKSTSITDILPGKPSTSFTNISTFIDDSLPGGTSIANSDKCTRMDFSLPTDKRENSSYKSSIITDLFSKLLPARASLPKNLSESVSDTSKSVEEILFDGKSLRAGRNYPERIAEVLTNQLTNLEQPLEHNSVTRKSSCYRPKEKLQKCYLHPPSSLSTAKDLKNETDPLRKANVINHQTEDFTDSIHTASGMHADIRDSVSGSIIEEPLLSSTKVTGANESANSITDNSEPISSTKMTLCGTQINDEFPLNFTYTSRSKLNYSPGKHNISKSALNKEGFEDHNESKDKQKEFLIYSGTMLSNREQVTGLDSNGVNMCDFNLNIRETTPSDEMCFSGSKTCHEDRKQSKTIRWSDEKNVAERECPITRVSEQQSHQRGQLRKSPGTSIIRGPCRNPNKSETYTIGSYCGNLNTTTDKCFTVVSGVSSGKEQKTQEESESPAENAKLSKVLWAVTRINIFKDESRTYEIMTPSEEAPTRIPETSECIFIVIPQKKST